MIPLDTFPKRLLRRAPRPLMLLAGAGFCAGLLNGCGFIQREEREAWRGEAERACLKSGQVRESAYARLVKSIDGPGICGAEHPIKLAALESLPELNEVTQAFAGDGQDFTALERPQTSVVTMIKPEATLACPMVTASESWVAQVVQPAALAWFGQPVQEIRTAGSYACRSMNHRPGARLSEHAFGNALDVMGFALPDGRIVKVISGWRGAPDEQGFLREVISGACQIYSTVLGPGADMFHHDHFHFDLARHDPRGQRRICKPSVEAPPRPDGSSPLLAANRPAEAQALARNAGRAQPPQPVLEETFRRGESDFDPRQFDVTGGAVRVQGDRNQPLPRRLQAGERGDPSAYIDD